MTFKHTLFALAFATGSLLASAETPRWLRNTAISPDGAMIAFTYKGDIFTVPVTGGMASQLTSGSYYDSYPIWSPDSKTIVFSSDREGSHDLYAVDAKGGTPRRLTTSSGTEKPLAFVDEGTVIFSSTDMPSKESSRHPTRLTRTYSIDITRENARPELYLSMPIGAAAVAADGRILYQDRKGLEDIYRKHNARREHRISGCSKMASIQNSLTSTAMILVRPGKLAAQAIII